MLGTHLCQELLHGIQKCKDVTYQVLYLIYCQISVLKIQRETCENHAV